MFWVLYVIGTRVEQNISGVNCQREKFVEWSTTEIRHSDSESRIPSPESLPSFTIVSLPFILWTSKQKYSPWPFSRLGTFINNNKKQGERFGTGSKNIILSLNFRLKDCIIPLPSHDVARGILRREPESKGLITQREYKLLQFRREIAVKKKER